MAAGAYEVTIYALCDPDTGEYRYVGKANNLPARLRSHKWEKSRLRTRKANWLRSLQGRDPMVMVLEVVPSTDWEATERSWIQDLRASGARLTNFADGGQTSPVEGKGHTEDTKAKLRAKALARGIRPPSRKGQPVSAEARAHYREAALRRGAKPPMVGGWNKGLKQTYCQSGHEYTAENTRLYTRPDRNQTHQICRACERQRLARWLLLKQQEV